MVEADGEWHTSDNKFASEGWRAPRSSLNVVNSESPRKEPYAAAPIPTPPSSSKNSSNALPPEIITLTDSEDDDERIVKQELSPKSGYATSQSQSFVSNRSRSGRTPPLPPSSKASSSNEIIDLTLDSDDDVPVTAPENTQKRKERDADDLISDLSAVWKRQRYCEVPGSGTGCGDYRGYANGSGTSSSRGGTVGLDGKSHPATYGETSSSGTNNNSWGSVRTPLPAQPQLPYQIPLSHAAPSSPGMPVHSQNLNGSYPNYGSSVVSLSSMDMAMSARATLPTSTAPYYNNQYGHPPPPRA